MQDFNDIQELWKQSETQVSVPKIDYQKIRSNKRNILNKLIFGGVLLTLTGIFILVLMGFLDENIRTTLVMASMITVTLICLLQAQLQFLTARKINQIDETQTPEKLLQQWQNFREFQKKQRHWNLPLYYLLLGTALGFYMFEILKTATLTMKLIAFVATYAWMFFAYFYLGKKELKKQDAKMDGIIAELKGLEEQFK